MLIRSFQKRDNRKKRIFTAIRIILLATLWRIIRASMTNYYKQLSILPVQNLSPGQIMTFQGTIQSTNNFPVYTHTAYTKDWVKVFLKSSTINLNSYQNQSVIIKWDIKQIYKGTTLIDVTELTIPDQWLQLKNNSYLFSKDLLLLDFKDQTQLSAKRTNKEIEVYYGEKKIFTIERFNCKTMYKSWNCDGLIAEYAQNEKDSFDSYRGYTYYKHGTGLRTMFDGNQFGYIFKNVEDSILLDISSNIKIVDPEIIISAESKQIMDACKFTTINGWNLIAKWDNNITIAFDGIDKDDNSNSCTLTFDTQNDRAISDIQK